MSAGLSPRPYDSIARRWCDLAVRRRAHFLELYDSGRWKLYYDEEQFLARMREAVASVEIWAQLAAKQAAIARQPGLSANP